MKKETKENNEIAKQTNFELHMKNIDYISGTTFESLLGPGNIVFEIPLFQRDYSWDEKVCEQFFNDILNSFNTNTTYYIGNFIFFSNNQNGSPIIRYTLIDGQQRMTSLFLLLCAIRNKYPKMNSITKEFLEINPNLKGYRYKLKQTSSDANDFAEIMDNNLQQKKSNIYIAYNYFYNKLGKSRKINNSNIENFYNYIKKLELLGIQLHYNEKCPQSAQDVFEKINSTGVVLSSSDLIRNYLLFSGNRQLQEKLYSYWKKIEEIVGKSNITSFSKSFLILNTFDDVKKEEVYSEFKKHFTTTNKELILKKMLKSATFYAMITHKKFYEIDNNNPDNIIEYQINENNPGKKDNTLTSLRTTFALLDKIGITEINPFILQLCDELYYSNPDLLDKICQLLLDFMIRYRICRPSAGGASLSKKIRDIMEKIHKKQLTITQNAIYKCLSEKEKEKDAARFPANIEFMEKLQNFVTITNARVLLFQFSRKKKEEPLKFNNNVTVEHLLPQDTDDDTPDGKWWIKNFGGQKDFDDNKEKYLDCIGNFALVSRALNSSMRNKKWPLKRVEILNRSNNTTTRQVAENNIWNIEKLIERNENLSAEICSYITGPEQEKDKPIKIGNKNLKSNWL